MLELSHRLVQAPLERFDALLRDGLREIAARLGASHALWYRRAPDGADYRLQLAWQLDSASAPPERVDAAQWTRLQSLLDANEMLALASRAALAAAIAERGAAPFIELGWQAAALVPLNGGDDCFGFLAFGKLQAGSSWRADEHALLALTAQTLVHSARHQAQHERHPCAATRRCAR